MLGSGLRVPTWAKGLRAYGFWYRWRRVDSESPFYPPATATVTVITVVAADSVAAMARVVVSTVVFI